MTVLGAPLFNRAATVYTADASGRYTVVARTGLACRLAQMPVGSGVSSAERAELLSTRRLSWEYGYLMPAFAEVEVDGYRWRVQGTPIPCVPELPAYWVALAVRRVPSSQAAG